MHLLFVLPLLFPHKHLLLCLQFESEGFEHLCSCLLYLVHRCALHEDSWKLKVCELVTLGSLDPRRPCGGWTFVVTCKSVREPPIPLWVVPWIVVERLWIPPQRIPIVEGEPNLCGEVHRRIG